MQLIKSNDQWFFEEGGKITEIGDDPANLTKVEQYFLDLIATVTAYDTERRNYPHAVVLQGVFRSYVEQGVLDLLPIPRRAILHDAMREKVERLEHSRDYWLRDFSDPATTTAAAASYHATRPHHFMPGVPCMADVRIWAATGRECRRLQQLAIDAISAAIECPVALHAVPAIRIGLPTEPPTHHLPGYWPCGRQPDG